ncbi:MAG: YbfB/YjiJ family MFS transporter [Burkholderiaceae bacterium]
MGAVTIALAGAVSLLLAMGVGRFAYTPMLPPMLETSGLTLSAAGIVASANFAGYLLGALLASRSSFVRHRVGWLRAGLLASAASTTAMAVEAGAVGWSAIRFVAGLASAFVLIYASAMVFEAMARARRPTLAAVPYSGAGIGIVLSALIVYAGRQADVGAAALWLAFGALSAAAMIVPWRCLTTPTTQTLSAAASAPGRRAGDRRRLNYLVWSYGCLGFGYVITATFIVVIVRQMPQAAVLELWAWLAVGLASVPSNWLWVRAAARIGRCRAIAAALLLEAVGVALVALGQTPAAVLAGGALLGGTFIAVSTLALVEARLLAPDRPDQAIAVMTVAFGAGQIIGPAVGGWLAERSGSFVAASWLAVAALIVGAGLAIAAAATAPLPPDPGRIQ